jgi:hypothetical protein
VQVGLAIQAWRGLSLCLAATTGEYLLEDLLIAPLFGYKISHIVANKQPSQTAKRSNQTNNQQHNPLAAK